LKSLRNYSKRVLILCEDGKSSLKYSKEFQKDDEFRRLLSSVKIEIYQPNNFSPVGLVSEALNKRRRAKIERNPFDEIWIVLDKNGHQNLPLAYNNAVQNKISVALSIICFEYWVLLHFERTSKPFSNCKGLINYLKKKHFSDYLKCESCFDTLRDKIQTAIKNGEWLTKNYVRPMLESGTNIYELSAYTNVHELVKKILNPRIIGK
jgi:hypothetical protein